MDSDRFVAVLLLPSFHLVQKFQQSRFWAWDHTNFRPAVKVELSHDSWYLLGLSIQQINTSFLNRLFKINSFKWSFVSPDSVIFGQIFRLKKSIYLFSLHCKKSTCIKSHILWNRYYILFCFKETSHSERAFVCMYTLNTCAVLKKFKTTFCYDKLEHTIMTM